MSDEIVLMDVLNNTLESFSMGGQDDLAEDYKNIAKATIFTAIVFDDLFYEDKRVAKQIEYAKLLGKPFYFCVKQGMVLPAYITDGISVLVVKYFDNSQELEEILSEANALANILFEKSLET